LGAGVLLLLVIVHKNFLLSNNKIMPETITQA
jgi:hypothetical protein